MLFLTPSISLLSQSLIDWANDSDLPLKPFAVCSDTRAGKRSSDDEDMSPYDLTETPSTNPEQLAAGFRRADRRNNMTVVFSTYQSLDIVAEAQKKSNGVPEFDLIICDEAHRTTGVSAKQLTGKDESNFQRVHDNGFIAGKKRLYMTATPRIYVDRARRKANESQLVLASMDDERLYGPEFHRLGFGKAIELGILSDYKVVIFNVDQEQTGVDLNVLLSDSDSEVNMDNGARMVGCWNGLGKRAAAGWISAATTNRPSVPWLSATPSGSPSSSGITSRRSSRLASTPLGTILGTPCAARLTTWTARRTRCTAPSVWPGCGRNPRPESAESCPTHVA